MTSVAIQTQQLTKQFSTQTAVNQVDLEIPEGEVYGLIGPNGAGKTTLIRLLATAEVPTTGQIAIAGNILRPNQANAGAKRQIGFLPDDFPLYNDLAVWHYLDYFARLYFLQDPERRSRIGEVLEMVKLTEKRDAIISTLSRGMKQRLGLARAIIHQPKVLLLDEPVSGLDPIARIQFREIVAHLRSAKMTILISSHILSDLQEMCSSIGVMERGRLVESRRLSELYQRSATHQILVRTIDRIGELRQILEAHPQVEILQGMPDDRTLKISFLGSELDAAELLAELIAAKFPISSFQYAPENLEAIFLKLGYQQTS
jgi:ABC-2 type transport system ATP-binding protein